MTTVTTVALLLVAGAAAVLVLAALVLLSRGLVERARRGGEPSPALGLALAGCAILLVVVGAKFATIASYSVDLPFWDQWDDEVALYVRFAQGSLSWARMFASHNEHRIFFTRVLTLLLEIANGQWDNRPQMMVSAILHAGTALALLALVARSGRKLEFVTLASLIVLIMAVPFAHENVVWGMQSQFYLDILFSVVGVGLAMTSRSLSGQWFLGLACASLAIVTLGSGVLAPTAIGLVMLLGLPSRRRERRPDAIAAAAALAIATAGLLALHRKPEHAGLAAHTVADFIVSLGRNAAWPAVNSPWLAPVLWLPIGVLAVAYVRRGGEEDDRVLLGLGAWVLMHATAIALARGAGGAGPAVRYVDVLSVGVVINAAAAFTLARRAPAGMGRRLASAMCVGWLAIPCVAGFELARSVFRVELPTIAELKRHQIENVRRYIATGDISALRDKPFLHIPYPSAEELADRLKSPVIRAIMPASVRPPLRLEPAQRGPFTWNALPQEASADGIPGAWTSLDKRAGGAFRSRQLAGGPLPYLSFGCLGNPKGEARFLGVEDADGRRASVARLSSRAPGWREWAVRKPDGNGRILAVDEQMGSWLAFRDPVEIGTLTFWCDRLLRHGPEMAAAGALLAMLGGLAVAWRGLRKPRTSSLPRIRTVS